MTFMKRITKIICNAVTSRMARIDGIVDLAPIVHGSARILKPVPPASRAITVQTGIEPWSYAASFKLTLPDMLVERSSQTLRVIIDLQVECGVIGAGCLSADLSSYTDLELKLPAGSRRKVYVPIGERGSAARLMIRNANPTGECSQVHIYGIEFRWVDQEEKSQENLRHSLWEVRSPAADGAIPRTKRDVYLSNQAYATIQSTLGCQGTEVVFPLALTHTTRVWDFDRCTQDYLRERYACPGRLDALPPFAELKPARNFRSYSGRLTFFEVMIGQNYIDCRITRCLDSYHKIQHAHTVNGKLVVCYEDYLLVLPSVNAALDPVASEHEIVRIDDPWFAGLHTVFPWGPDCCLVSASAPDAVLLVDLVTRKVVERWRLPPEIYGRNYELTPEMSVHAHYIDNDIQLGHLNCAFPDDRGGFWLSTLGQGDVGHVRPDGAYERLLSGFVGCHGIRYSDELNCLYFVDSCSGRLMSIDDSRATLVLGSVNSCWLHDAQHLAGSLFLLCLGDRNEISILDTSSNIEIARFSMKTRGENVQFLKSNRSTVLPLKWTLWLRRLNVGCSWRLVSIAR